MVALATLFVLLFPLGLGLLVWRRVSRLGRVSRRLTIGMTLGGAVAAGFSAYFERVVLSFTGLSLAVATSGAGGALLATFLLAAPLEEALKVGVVWPLYRTRRIDGPRLGVCYASAAVSGAVSVIAGGASGLSLLRASVSAPAHLFFAGLWGYTLGARGGTRGHWFSLAWLAATLLHGLYAHIVWGRGPGLLVTVIRLFLFMGLGAWVALRDVAPDVTAESHSLIPDPPSLRRMR